MDSENECLEKSLSLRNGKTGNPDCSISSQMFVYILHHLTSLTSSVLFINILLTRVYPVLFTLVVFFITIPWHAAPAGLLGSLEGFGKGGSVSQPTPRRPRSHAQEAS